MESLVFRIEKDGKVLVEAPITIYGDDPIATLNDAIVVCERTLGTDATQGALVAIDITDVLRAMVRNIEAGNVTTMMVLHASVDEREKVEA